MTMMNWSELASLITALQFLTQSKGDSYIVWIFEVPMIIPQSKYFNRDVLHLWMKFCTHKHF